jgi:ADP-ribosylglycohydrolase
MSIAVSEVLLEGGEFTRERFANSFVNCFKRDERDGYVRSFQAFLEEVASGADFLKYIQPDSDKSGAAMRAVPIGVLSSPAEVIAIADLQAKITHDTTMGRESAIFVALMSHFALYTDEPFSGLRAFLAKHRPQVRLSENKVLWDGPVVGPNVGWNTTMAVLTLLETEATLLDITKRTILWGGDVDSVLAIAWGIASTRMHHELPAFFDGGLENGTYGRRFLADLGARLMVKYTT